MDIKPTWECRTFENGYQISAIARVGERVFRACELLSFEEFAHSWTPKLLMEDMIRMTNNSLYDMIERNK